MSTQYIEDIEDSHGDIVDRNFYCHRCTPAEVLPWPCYEATDSPEFCHECGTPTGNDLTDDGVQYLREMLAEPHTDTECADQLRDVYAWYLRLDK